MRKNFVTGAAILALLMNAPHVSADDEIVIFGGEFEDEASTKKADKPAPTKDLPREPRQVERHDNLTSEPRQVERHDNLTSEPRQVERHDNLPSEPRQVERHDDLTSEPRQVERHDDLTSEPRQVERHDDLTSEPRQLERHDNLTSEPRQVERHDNLTSEPRQLERHDDLTSEPRQLERHDNLTSEPRQVERHDNLTSEPRQVERHDNLPSEPRQVERHDNLPSEPRQVERHDNLTSEPRQVERHDNLTSEPRQVERHDNLTSEPRQVERHDDLTSEPRQLERHDNLPSEPRQVERHDNLTSEPRQVERPEDLMPIETERPFQQPINISGDRVEEPIALPTRNEPPSIRRERVTSSAPQQSLKTLKQRFIKLAADDTYTYYLDKQSVQWKKMPYMASEYMADVWIRMVEHDPAPLDDDMAYYGRENFNAEVALAREQGYQYSPEDLQVLSHQAYVLEHYYLRPKTNQIQFLCELEVFGRPQNTINERAYDYKNWENLVPGSVESVIYAATLKTIGKGKASERGHMTFFDMLDEYARIALN